MSRVTQFRAQVAEARGLGHDRRAILEPLAHLAADRARQREHRRIRERQPDRPMLPRLRHALRELVARAAHPAALVQRIADAAERPRLIHRRPGPPRPGERILVRHQAFLDLAAREVDVAAQRPDPREQLRPLVAREHGLRALQRLQRLVVAIENAQRIREREPRARLHQRIGPKVDHLAQRRDGIVRVPGARLQLAEKAAREAEVHRLAREHAGFLRELDARDRAAANPPRSPPPRGRPARRRASPASARWPARRPASRPAYQPAARACSSRRRDFSSEPYTASRIERMRECDLAALDVE